MFRNSNSSIVIFIKLMNSISPSKEFKHLLFLGDTHGNNKQIAPHILKTQTKIPREDSKVIVHVGDFGIGFASSIKDEMNMVDAINTMCIEHNIMLYVIRGNHDNPTWFNKIHESWFSNIVFVEDHSLLTVQLVDRDKPVKIYCIGGAISINRSTATNGIDYWNDENFKLPTSDQLLEIPKDLDAIVTHNRPLGCHPTIFNESVMKFCLLDKTLEEELRNEQKEMKILFDSIRERNNSRNNIIHYFGHYHWNHRERIGDIAHVTIAKDTITEYRG